MTREDAKVFLDNIKLEELGRAIGASDFYSRLIGYHVQALNMATEALEQKPKTGHWIEQEDFNGDTYYDCSECGESFCLIEGTPTDNLYKYCPNCGAKMEEHDADNN